MIWLTVIWFFTGTIYTLINARFELIEWDYYYFIWEAGCFVLCFGTIMSLLPKAERWIIKPVFYYSITRFLWELIFPITAWDVNHPMAVNTASLIIITGLVILLLKDLEERWKRN